MAELPVVSGEETVKCLTKAGFQVARRKGSHVSLQKGHYRTVVPLHYELAKGTLLGTLKQCGLTRGDLKELLRKPRRSSEDLPPA